MRPTAVLLMLLLVLCLMTAGLSVVIGKKRLAQEEKFRQLQTVVSLFALSDLAISTEARYTRHPAVSDSVVIGMDHPGAVDHFPSTMFWVPVR